MHTLQQKFTNRFVKSAASNPDADFTNQIINALQDAGDTINREDNPVTDYTRIGGLLSSGVRGISKLFPGVNGSEENLSFLQKVPFALRNFARTMDRNPNLSAGIGVGVPAAAAAAAYLFNKNKKKSKEKVGMILEQAFVNGFVKRAAQCGLNEMEAVELLKAASSPAPAPAPAPAPPPPAPSAYFQNLGSKADEVVNRLTPNSEFSRGAAAAGAALPGLQSSLGYLTAGEPGRGMMHGLIGTGSGVGAALAKGSKGRGAAFLAGQLGPWIYDRFISPRQQAPVK